MTNKPAAKGFSAIWQAAGFSLDKNAAQRIESGERFVTDIKLRVITKALQTPYPDLPDPR